MHALKVWAVVRREFIERVRTKWFIISTVLGPVFLIGIMVLPAVLATQGTGPRTIAIVDEASGGLAERVVAQLGAGNKFIVSLVKVDARAPNAALDTLTSAVQAKRIDGFLLLKPTTLETGKFEYRGRNVASIRDEPLYQLWTRRGWKPPGPTSVTAVPGTKRAPVTATVTSPVLPPWFGETDVMLNCTSSAMTV